MSLFFVVKRGRDKCFFFKMVQNFALWASIGVACSYASRPFLSSLALVYPC